MALDPSTLLQEAVRAVPAVKYALGVAGLLAVLGIAKAFDLDPAFAAGGTLVVLALMVVLLIFAKLSANAAQHFVLPALFLTWGSLGLVLASAGMLFTSAFFGRPIDLRPVGKAVAPETTQEAPRSTAASDLAPQIELRREVGDYTGAWTLVGEALEKEPAAPELGALQARIAEEWLLDTRVPKGDEFVARIEELLRALSRRAAVTDKQAAADALAHIGWLDFLRTRANPTARLDPEPSYRKALALDPANPYANVLLGHWLVRQGRSPAEVQPYFDAALAGGRAREVVRRYQIAGLEWSREAPFMLAVLRICNEMRQNGEALEAAERRDIVSRTYYRPPPELSDALEAALPPRQHLATLSWLVDGTDLSDAPYVRFFQARLYEAAGECARALPIYAKLLELDTIFTEQIEAGVARCKKP